MKKKLVFMTGAGISKESGLSTFRDSDDGLWNNFNIKEVSSLAGWYAHPEKVLDFYNHRRREMLSVKPNHAHDIIAKFENDYDVTIITQNIDDLHERAGSTNVIHLHGEILKVREVDHDIKFYNTTYKKLPWRNDLNIGDLSENGIQLRPDVVWFGEFVYDLGRASIAVEDADAYVVIGTSSQVHPASILYTHKNPETPGYIINPVIDFIIQGFTYIEEPATIGIDTLKRLLFADFKENIP